MNVPASARLNSIRIISDNIGSEEWLLSREIEANAHAFAYDLVHYNDCILRCAYTCHNNASMADPLLIFQTDEEACRGTRLEQVRNDEQVRRQRFESMLREKMDMIAHTGDLNTSLKCRKCKSSDVSWDLKQTRSADEACTAFCVCASCGNRWTIH